MKQGYGSTAKKVNSNQRGSTPIKKPYVSGKGTSNGTRSYAVKNDTSGKPNDGISRPKGKGMITIKKGIDGTKGLPKKVRGVTK